MSRRLTRLTRLAVAGLVAGVLAACTTNPSLPASSPAPPISLAPSTPAPSASSTAASSSEPPGRPVLAIPARDFPNPPPGPGGLERYLGQKPVWKDCDPGVQCAELLAPLDYAKPDRAAIKLALARRMHGAGSSKGALFVNPGGPGGSGVEMVKWFQAERLYRFDIVSWDVRGSGDSTAARCYGADDMARLTTMDSSPDSPAEDEALARELRRFGASCLERSGDLLNHVSTAETVRDLDLIRAVLDYPKISYLGFSYGTLIGSLYAERYPRRVDQMVLDGAVSLDPLERLDQVAGFERAFDHFASWCADRSCALGDSRREVVTKVQDLLLGLDAELIKGVGKRQLTQQEAVQAVFASLYGSGPEGAWADLLKSLTAATRGNGSLLLKEADRANFRKADGSYDSFAYAFPAIRCADSRTVSLQAAQEEFKIARAQAPVLAELSGPDYACAVWPVAPAPTLPKIDASGAPPIVVIGSTGDPATPYEWAQGMAEQLDGSVLVTRRGEGHTGFGNSQCINELVYRYFLQDELPKRGTVC